jgi:hypothetical protein
VSGGGRGLRWYTRTGAAYREGGARAAPGDGPPGAVSGSEVPGSAPDGEVGAAPGDDGPGPAGEPGQVPGRERGEAVPAGDHGKGGWTTVSAGKRRRDQEQEWWWVWWRRERRTNRTPHVER